MTTSHHPPLATTGAGPAVPPPATVVDGVDVDVLAAAVRGCPAVADLSGGPFGAAATHLPGRRVTGIVVRGAAGQPAQVEIRVVARYGPTMATVAEQVHAVAAAVAPGARHTVAIDDLADPAGPVDPADHPAPTSP